MNEVHEKEEETTQSTTEDKQNNCPLLAETAFRLEEKKYKLYKPTKVGRRLVQPPETDFSEVLDFRDISKNSDENRAKMHRVSLPAATKEMYTFSGLPGLVFLPNFLSVKEQQYWMSRSLNDFSSAPFPNNETTLVNGPEGEKMDPEKKQEILNRKGYRNGLRWATLGYSYNWSKKTYHPDEKVEFPSELSKLVKEIVHDYFAFAFPPLSEEYATNYEGQTSIVNYFPGGSQMCAHQDVSEAAMEKPLVSISLGCTSVFLMGTTNRDDKPFAMFLRSGDVVVFSGMTRAAFHAVPRILDDTPEYLISDASGLPGLRVNINVRQVFDEKHGPESLPDMKDFKCQKTANALKLKQEREKEQSTSAVGET